MEFFHDILMMVVEGSVFFFEAVGVIIIIFGGLQGIYDLIKNKEFGNRWSNSLVTGLGFLLIGEVLHTVGVDNFSGLAMVGGVFALRAFISILIHWEMKD